MRYLTILFATLFIAVAALSSCNNQSETLYNIEVKSEISCLANATEVQLEYSLRHTSDSNITVCATTNAEWVTVADNTTQGIIKFAVEDNTNVESRTATITLLANGYNSAKITLTQWGIAPDEANHTLMYLFMGTNLGRYFNTNIEDTTKAIEQGILGNSNRVVFFRQESKSKGYIAEICYDTDKCCYAVQIIENIELNNGLIEAQNVADIIAKMAATAPAKRYGLVCAGHGQAWIPRDVVNSKADIAKFDADYNPWIQAEGAETTRAYGEDNTMLNIPELRNAIELSNVELDYILFDACFMANIETVYDLRNVANYIIASPCEIMGKGFPYTNTLPYLFTDNGNATDYVGAAESYHHYYRYEYTQNARSASITVFNCTEVEALADATREVVKSATSEYDINKLQTYEGQRTHHFYDFGQWVRTVATDAEALARFNTQFAKAVVKTFTLDSFYSAYGNYGTYPINRDVYTGVTTSAPSLAYPNAWKQTDWYKDVCAVSDN
ncbi:MAG: hypothetical protein IKV29_00230 [Alistipes sp.]|nr:hypothetical protein [Alistipes sp.]